MEVYLIKLELVKLVSNLKPHITAEEVIEEVEKLIDFIIKND